MRRRLAGGVLVPSFLLLAIAGACSTFGDEDRNPVDAPAPEAGSDVSSTDGPPVEPADGGVDAPVACGRCEGACVPGGGCVPIDPAPDFPTTGNITGLDVGTGDVYVASTTNGGSLWRIDIPKPGKTSSAVMMTFNSGAMGVAVFGNYVHSALNQSAAAKTVLAHVARGSGPGANILRSDKPCSRVGASDNYAYGATDNTLHACNRGDLYNSCTMLGPIGVAIDRLAVAGAKTYCIHGTWEDGDSGVAGAVGIYCGEDSNPPMLRAEVASVSALAVRGARVFWATDTTVESVTVSGAPDALSFPASGVTALIADATDLFVATDSEIFRCPKENCIAAQRVVLTAASGIDRLALSADDVYFSYGTVGTKRLGRAPRRP